MSVVIQENIKFCVDIDENNINKELIVKLINTHKDIVQKRFKKLENYYKGNQDILNRVIDDPDKPNNKPVSNFCSYVSDTLTSFFMGKNVTYTSKNKEHLADLFLIYNENDEKSVNMELASKSSIKGTAYELVYQNENAETCVDALDTDSVILVYNTDIRNEPVMGIRYYTIADYVNKDNSITKVDIYTKNYIYHFRFDDKLLIEDGETEQHYFGEVPIIEYPNNRYRRSDFEQIITLQDMYNKNFADVSNDIEYYSLCYLILENMAGTTKEDIKVIKENRTILTPENGKAYFLTKDLKDAVTQNHRNNLKEDMYRVSSCPDLSQDLPSNLSGSAIKQKFFNCEMVITVKESMFRKSLQKRIRLITKMLNLKGKSYDWRDIEITYNRNIPINYIELADSAIKLKGIISNESLIKMVGQQIGIDDVDKELEKVKAEQQDYVDLYNIHSTGGGDNDQ